MTPQAIKRLAVVLGRHGRELDRVLATLGGVRGLLVATEEELKLAGVSRERARVLVAFRAVLAEDVPPERVQGPKDVWRLVRAELGHSAVERLAVVLLDGAHGVIHVEVVSVGSARFTVVDPPSIFRLALIHRAAAVVVAHNHPSGLVEPSRMDLTVTDTLERAGRAIGIPVLDHLVVTRTGYTSIAETRGVRVPAYEPTVLQGT